jgi:hypothetical protein
MLSDFEDDKALQTKQVLDYLKEYGWNLICR